MCALALVPASARAQGPSSEAAGRFAYAQTADAVVIQYREVLGEIEDPDPGPSLAVYGDGRIAVHYPRYMKRAGDYADRLSPAELRALVSSLVSKDLMDFDAEAAHRRKAELEASRRAAAKAAGEPELYQVFDRSTVEVEIRLERYRPAGAAPDEEQRDVYKRIRWKGLRPDAKRYREHASIQKLAEADRELRALLERPGLARAP